MKYSLAALALLAASVSAQECSPLHLVYARATGEPPQPGENPTAQAFEAAAAKPWSKGYGAAGYSLYSNLTKLVSGASGYPVHYAASSASLSTILSPASAVGTQGAKDYLDHLSKMSKQCPQQKYALGGHSQGGFLTVAIIPKIPSDILNKVVAVTMFGSPACPAQVRGRCNSYCNAGDSVCAGSNRGKAGAGGKGGKGKGGEGTVRDTGTAPKGDADVIGKGVIPPKSASPLCSNEAIPARNTLLAKRQVAPDCAKYADAPVSGHQPSKGGNGHLAYNADGYYVHVAACYIATKFVAAKGS